MSKTSPDYDAKVLEEGGYVVELSNRGVLRKWNPAPANLEKAEIKCLFTECHVLTRNMAGLCTEHIKEYKAYKKERNEKGKKNVWKSLPIKTKNGQDDQWPSLIHSRDWIGRLIPPDKTREDCLTDAPRHTDIAEALIRWMNKDTGRMNRMDDFIQAVLEKIVGNVPHATQLQDNYEGKSRKGLTPDDIVKMTIGLVEKHFPKNEFGETRLDFGRYKERELKDLPIRVAAALLILAYACEEANRGDYWFALNNPKYKHKQASAYMPSVYYLLRRHTKATVGQATMCLKS